MRPPAPLLRTLLATLRPPFLLLTPACVALGLAAAVWAGHRLTALPVTVVLLGALAAHASVNMLNEWADFRSGLDSRTRRTALSGGSGALPAAPQAAPLVLAGGLLALALAGVCGVWLVATAGPALLPLGLAGVALVLAYTPWLTRQPLACLLAPGLGFGPLMTGGAALAVAGRPVPGAFVVSLLPMALVSALLLLNQFPDVDADRSVGRRHLPMLWGRPRAARLFGALLLLAYVVLPAGVAAGALPVGVLAGVATAPLAWWVARGVRRHADDLPALAPAMGANVLLVLATPLLAAGGGLWGGHAGP